MRNSELVAVFEIYVPSFGHFVQKLGDFFHNSSFSISLLLFGNSLSNIPTSEDLGSIGGILNEPQDLYVFNEGGNWYAMIFGALPLLLSDKIMYVSRQNLAIVIIGGLVVGTFFSLFVVPMVYVLIKKNKLHTGKV